VSRGFDGHEIDDFRGGDPRSGRDAAEIHPPVGIPGMSVTISGGRRTGRTALTGRAANVLTANDRPWRARSGSKRFFRSESEPNTRTATKNIP
jgi:hypothetical protein